MQAPTNYKTGVGLYRATSKALETLWVASAAGGFKTPLSTRKPA